MDTDAEEFRPTRNASEILGVRINDLANDNPLSANPTKWSNKLRQFVGNLPTNCLSVFDHFINLALKGIREKDLSISSIK